MRGPRMERSEAPYWGDYAQEPDGLSFGPMSDSPNYSSGEDSYSSSSAGDGTRFGGSEEEGSALYEEWMGGGPSDLPPLPFGDVDGGYSQALDFEELSDGCVADLPAATPLPRTQRDHLLF